MALIELLSEEEARERTDVDIDEVMASMPYDHESPYLRVRFHNPALIKAANEFRETVLDNGLIDDELYEFVKVAAAQADECEYCTSSHRKKLKEAAGLSSEEMVAVARQEYGALDEFSQTVMEFTDQVVTDPHSVTEADIDSLRKVGFEERDIIQLLHVIEWSRIAHTINNTLNVSRSDSTRWLND